MEHVGTPWNIFRFEEDLGIYHLKFFQNLKDISYIYIEPFPLYIDDKSLLHFIGQCIYTQWFTHFKIWKFMRINFQFQ